MTGKIKQVGLAFAVIAAMSMAATSAAQATELHAATGPNASIFGQQTTENTFTTDFGTIKGTQALFEGTAASQTAGTTTAQELTLTPTYTGVKAFGLNATIDMNGCEYTITGSGQPALTATADIVCNKTAGKVIEITAIGGCTVTIPPQAVGGHLVLTNGSTAPVDVSINFTLSGIKYEGHGVCPTLEATVLTSNGTYFGSVTLQAREHRRPVQAGHNGHVYQKLLQTGALVALSAT